MLTVLLNPPSPSPQPVIPLGLAFLAAALQKNGHPVKIIDAWAEGFDLTELAIRLRSLSDVGLIGLSIMSPGFDLARQTIEMARQACPKAKIIAGGTHPSALPQATLEQIPTLDFVCVGEGDNLIVQLADALQCSEPPFLHIPGLGWRDTDRIRINGRAAPIEDLNALPRPAMHELPLGKYRMHPPYRILRSAITMITSRGCPYGCSYCTKSVSGRHFRWQQPNRILDDISFYQKEFGVRQIHFYDDEFTMPRQRTIDFCQGILERRMKFLWSCVTRVDLVDEELLRLMKKAGCWLISYGVESGNQQILDEVQKGYTVSHIRSAFRLTKGVGIRTLGYFMAGFPGETAETLNQTIRLSHDLDPDFVSWSILALYPGSALYDQQTLPTASNGGTESPRASSLSPFSHGSIAIYKGSMPREIILQMVGKAYRSFYFRPGYILRSIQRLQTLSEGLSYLRTLVQYLRWVSFAK